MLPFLPLRLGALRRLLPLLPRVPVRFGMDLVLRLGRAGDLFGLRRGGLSMRKLRDRPHGVVLAEHLQVGEPREHVWHKDRRVHLCPAEIADEVTALRTGPRADSDYPLRMIGMRDLRSHNSWMHNSPVADLEKLAGMARLTGIPVRLEGAPERPEPADSRWVGAEAPVTGPPTA